MVPASFTPEGNASKPLPMNATSRLKNVPALVAVPVMVRVGVSNFPSFFWSELGEGHPPQKTVFFFFFLDRSDESMNQSKS